MSGGLRVVASLTTALAAIVACSGSSSPQDDCRTFLDLTQRCYAQSGRQIGTNPAACDDPSTLDQQTKTQISCVLQHQDAYCNSIVAAGSGDAGAINPRDPELVKLNACYAAASLAEPCKDAVLALADCGAGIGFPPDCSGASAALAQCVLDHKAGACSLYAPREAGATSLTPDEQAFQQCQIDAQRAALDASRD
jgi:hypothetical protein